MHIDTLLIHGDEGDRTTGAASTPIYQASSFRHHTVGQEGGYQYSRGNNPTRHALEKQMALLEGGCRGFAFGSGMAAITAVFNLFKTGDHIIASRNLYGGTSRVLDKIFSRFGLTVAYVDFGSLAGLAAAITPATKALVIETPSNPTLMVTDISGVAALARERGLLTIADNTFMSPYLQQPLRLGVDIVIHSATKFIGGHSDVLAGVVVVKEDQLAEDLHFVQNSTGGVLGPFDSWLLLRGLKTLGLRLDRQSRNAGILAAWLRQRREVQKVYYLGFADHPGYELHQSQARGPGNVVAFDVGDGELARHILGRLRFCMLADSLGGVETMVNLSDVMSHGSVPATRKLQMGITPSLIRLSAGIEDPADIIADFEQAMSR
ncbi:trans-sulfuration enzyme family protein [Sporomusa termitida]|uniref:Cystathionine gamma-lyase n=1 Tax=Sporomusa termitida TaxID=2377 RepID=A0A517DRK5_9FIRM|nr:aminotransferase class V-fold PLP-dependent enzyme [Sporomusa termitida]QDR79989.1 Cystathionine gamma-lyase [Sporomusa termitida]